MVSMICHEALNKIVKENNILEADKILNAVRDIVVDAFEGNLDNLNDGMDIALCILKNNNVEFAGAYNPLWIIRNGELLEFKGDKQPIGNYDQPFPFTKKSIPLLENDNLYIFSDGYADQFGGDKGKKLKTTNFKKLLLRINQYDMSEQKLHLDKSFDAWRGSLEQLDDVCVVGIKI